MKSENKFTIRGGKPLHGSIQSSGAKNAALKMIAAACLTKETITIHNVPHIQDVLTMLELLAGMGADISWSDSTTVSITCDSINPDNLDQAKIGNLRGSVVLIGPLCARFGSLRIHEPGGCVIGARPITTHIHALHSLGYTCSKQGKFYIFESTKPKGSRILLDEISVTTTENALLAATCTPGITEIHLAATEPEIANLIDLLCAMGANIEGINTSIIRIRGATSLHGASATVIPDRIEIGTFAIALAATHGSGTITNVIPNHLDNILNKFDRMGIHFSFKKPIGDTQTGDELNDLIIESSHTYTSINFDTRPYPGFSTDLQSQMVVLLTQTQGKSSIFETLFEGRLAYTKYLIEMGADITIEGKHLITLRGPCQLKGVRIETPDLRAGAALVLAGLVAHGETIVTQTQSIDRGYEQFDEKLKQLGADIKRD